MTGRVLLLLLVGLVFTSGLLVVYSSHESRKLFIQTQGLQQERDRLNVNWGRLQLEQSTWSTDGRIEAAARKQLNMHLPSPGAVVIVTP